MPANLAAVVMAGGLGTRMKSEVPKHFHPLLGRWMVDWVIDTVRALDPDPLVIVTSRENAAGYEGVEIAIQDQPLGTGDAVRSAAGVLDGFEGDILVLNGDVPALRSEV